MNFVVCVIMCDSMIVLYSIMCSIIIKNDVVARLNRFQTSRLSSGECNRAFYSCLPAKTSGFAVDQKKTGFAPIRVLAKSSLLSLSFHSTGPKTAHH